MSPVLVSFFAFTSGVSHSRRGAGGGKRILLRVREVGAAFTKVCSAVHRKRVKGHRVRVEEVEQLGPQGFVLCIRVDEIAFTKQQAVEATRS